MGKNVAGGFITLQKSRFSRRAKHDDDNDDEPVKNDLL